MSKRSIFGYLEEASGRGGVRLGGLSKHERWVEAILPADADVGAVEHETNKRPLVGFGGIIVLLLGILGLRLFYLQVIQGNHNLQIANGNRTRTQIVHAPRGLIYDRNRTLLANNVASYDITVVTQQLPNNDTDRTQEYAELGRLLGIPASQIASQVTAGCQTKKVVECYADATPKLVKSDITREQSLLFAQDSASYPGFNMDANPVRQYLDSGSVLAQVIGYTGRVSADDLTSHPDYQSTDYIGKTGLEYQYESLLRGIDGGQETEVDATGRPVRVLTQKSPQPGHSLVLSIDMGLQQQLAANLQNEMNADVAAKPTQAAAIAINPNTGEILAMVSLPTYDHNLFAKGISEADFTKLINDKAQPLFNKAIGGTYPTGSIIKPLVASAGLQTGAISTSTVVDDNGALNVPNAYNPDSSQSFHDYEAGGFGMLNLFKAMAVSSNVFFMTVGGGFGNITGLGVDRLTHFYQQFGLGSKTGIDLPGESAGLVPTPAWKQKSQNQPWYTGDTYNISIGQGDMQVTPLQMAVAISSIANGGKVIQPHLVDQVLDSAGKVIQTMPVKLNGTNGVSADNLKSVQQAMREVVSEPYGTGCCLINGDNGSSGQVPVHVAAKTGTAENGSDEAHAWFEAYAPYEDPQIVIVALVAHGGEGGYIAAPVVRQTLAWYFTQGAGKTMGPRTF